MSYGQDEGPVYYREIQKNAYLKRIPNETGGSKLRPLGSKRPPAALKPMWTQFCVHNGRSPYLEQYPVSECPATLAHKPVWRASLTAARHVTASVKPRAGLEYDFLIDTDHGPVRMIAPDWESMQDWVVTLRNKLHELRILSKGENVYCPAPAPPAPRAAARDPTSPLPPTPPVPPDRVPGIELAPPLVRAPPEDPEPERPELPELPDLPAPEDVDISSWDEAAPSGSAPVSSQEKVEPTKSVTKICGQNICLDDSILKRSASADSDEEPPGRDRLTLRVPDEGAAGRPSDRCPSNVTVIRVPSNPPARGPAHPSGAHFGEDHSFVNIVNTEVNVNSENGYGTVFDGSDYGHLSLATTVTNLDAEPSTVDQATVDPSTVGHESGAYERLCLATSEARLKVDSGRKSSLPNLPPDSTYEYLYPGRDRNVVAVSAEDAPGPADSQTSTTAVPNGRPNTTQYEPNLPSDATEENQNGITAASNVNSNIRAIRATLERSHSQNACDAARAREDACRRVQNTSPRRDGRTDKNETQTKPIWKRGLTELSLLTRLRGLGQGRRPQGAGRDADTDRSGSSPVKVVHRSRPEARVDGTRRRSSSLSNGQSPPSCGEGTAGALVPLRRRQALCLQADQRRRAAVPAAVPAHNPPALAEYDKRVWIAWWTMGGGRCLGRTGDRLAAVRALAPRDVQHAKQLIKTSPTPLVDILFHRVPLGKIFLLNKRDQESIGIKLDGECNIVSVSPGSPAARGGVPPPGKWAVTEVNNRPLNLIKGGEEEMNRLSLHGTEVSILIQPSALVKKLRAAIKSHKRLYSP